MKSKIEIKTDEIREKANFLIWIIIKSTVIGFIALGCVCEIFNLGMAYVLSVTL